MAQKLLDISMLGNDQLQRDLNALKHSTGRRIVGQSLKAAAQPVAVGAAIGSPVLTGANREHITVERAKGLRRGQFGYAVVTGTRAELKIDPKDDYYYPVIVEHGQNHHESAKNSTRARQKATARKVRRIRERKSISHRIVPPKPYLRPAFDGRVAQSLANISNEIGQRVEKAWKRAAR